MIPVSSTCFGQLFCPPSGALDCVTACDRGCIVPQAVKHNLVFLKGGKIIARNILSCLELLISRYCCIQLVVYIIYINDARSSKYQIMKYIC